VLDQVDCLVAGAENEKVGAVASIEQGPAGPARPWSRDELYRSPRGERRRLLTSRVTRGASVDEADDRCEGR
jgi:hypothetical protein